MKPRPSAKTPWLKLRVATPPPSCADAVLVLVHATIGTQALRIEVLLRHHVLVLCLGDGVVPLVVHAAIGTQSLGIEVLLRHHVLVMGLGHGEVPLMSRGSGTASAL